MENTWLSWIENALAVIGIFTSLYSAIILILDRLGFYSWLGIQLRSKKLIRKIRNSGFIPDVIVGLGRSGAVLGGILAGNMGVIPITVIDRTYEWSNGKSRKVIPIPFIKPEMIAGKKVLLVDAAPHTGETCKMIKEELLDYSPKELRIASLFKYAYAIQVPDYFVSEVQKVRKMPWRFTQDYREDFSTKVDA